MYVVFVLDFRRYAMWNAVDTRHQIRSGRGSSVTLTLLFGNSLAIGRDCSLDIHSRYCFGLRTPRGR